MKMVHVLILILILFLIVQASSCNDKTSSSKFVKQFMGSKRGDTVKGLEQVRIYLSKYGYMSPSTDGHYQRSLDTFNDLNVFDHALKKGIKKFQLFFNTNVSGILDNETLSIMVKHRFNFPDLVNGTSIKHGMKLVRDPFNNSYFAFLGPKWSKYSLTWAMHNQMPVIFTEPLESAFKTWHDNSMIFLSKASSFNTADVKIYYLKSDRFGDRFAQAFHPPSGTLEFNAEVTWGSIGHPDTIDIESAALHEIGHILGLDHSEDPSSIMWPFLEKGELRRVLGTDDIHGIFELYF
ncbi:metalloendoproteinase 2-MMP-like [Impatiens glandulifera]|uniref:metalloendoproteinase 2-MMP-like n=1 Tax=Impatiens glandulifera TaxID=253017 RepID=UPI001FB10299|nr:metalloendoproteinase 2-MMP-like [Impatiens glandulifera]